MLLRVQWLPLLYWIGLCELAGIIGSFFTISSIDGWYTTLVRPSFSPPNYLFGPVWIALYATMGIAAYRISSLGMQKKAVRFAMALFGIHLLVNAIWSIIFFGVQNIPLAFIDISALWIMIIVLIFKFKKLDTISAWLMVPYLLWVSFATVLNYNIWLLNP